MKKIQILLVLLIIMGCSGEKKTKRDYVMHEIDFLNRTLAVPKNYERITFDQYQDIIRESYVDSAYVAVRVKQIETAKSVFTDYALFCDLDDIRNTLTILGMDNPVPNDYLGRALAKQIHADARKRGAQENFVYKPLNNSLIKGWLFKIKGERYYKADEQYWFQTTYMTRDFGAYVVHFDKEMDFEEEFTKKITD